MSTNKSEIIYDMHKHIPEIYDQIEDETHDIKFIIDLIKDKNIENILEPFCGNGRIMLPLAEAGYEVCGMDLSINMLNHFKKKFITAEIVALEDFIAVNGWNGSKEQGKMKLAGKDYVMRENEVVLFRTGA